MTLTLNRQANPRLALPAGSRLVGSAPLRISQSAVQRTVRRYNYGIAVIFSLMLTVLVVVGTLLLWAPTA
jgi:hypothetical protein